MPALGNTLPVAGQPTAQPPPAQPSEPRPLVDLERDAIEAALRFHAGNRTRAADALGIGVRTLYDKIKRYGLEEEPAR
jgi:two-component system response regulator FlrC